MTNMHPDPTPPRRSRGESEAEFATRLAIHQRMLVDHPPQPRGHSRYLDDVTGEPVVGVPPNEQEGGYKPSE